jgi:aryl-alcohol dehydrogenase-like predicted oxidoreductase
MLYRTIGRTGLRVSAIGFGCGGGAGLMVRDEPERHVEAISRALDLGIDYFDTAPIYGDKKSEANLGRALRTLGAKPHVATKVALEIDQLDDVAGSTVRSVEESLERLGLDSVDIVYLHNRVGAARAPKPDIGVGALLTVDDILGSNGVAEGFERLRKRGLARHFGCCSFGGEMALLEQVIASDKFDAMLTHYSLLTQTAFLPPTPGSKIHDYHEIAAHATARGMGTAILRVLEAGALAYERHPLAGKSGVSEFDWLVEQAHSLDFLREPDEKTLVPAAIRFALANDGVSVILVGISEVSQVDDAVAAVAKGPLGAEALARIEAVRQAGFVVGA